MTSTLQPLLSKDKQNPYLSVYQSTEDKNQLEVYFELALLEKIKNGITSYHGKHLLARLYNANFKRKTLVETFGIALTTLRRWGEALLTGDPLVIHKAFSGQGAEKKITPEIKRYIISKYNEIYETEKYRYSSIILSGIKTIFDETLTSESIRPIINIQKKKLENINKNAICSDVLIDSENLEKNENCIENEIKVQEPQKSISEANSCDSCICLASKTQNNRKYSLSKQKNEGFRIHHLGIILALYLINELKFEEKIVYQWLGSILAGAVNIEQTASLDFKSLEFLLDQVCITTRKHQQTLLTKIATEENSNKIFRQNAELLDVKNSQYFYFDSHSINYKGMQSITKGWCGSSGKTCKVYYQDFFHDEKGNPVYFQIFDNYFDMRERFKYALIDDFREIILDDKEAKPTFIIDRGIYGKEKMIAIANKGVGLVTWEKGYSKSAWNSNLKIKEFLIQRPKNNSKDIKTWNVRFIKDETWKKIDGFYRLIVKIKPPQKKHIKPKEYEVSILSNGYIPDLDAVKAMLNRWIQENDFKYMIEHFGLNEITSYKYYTYSEMKNILKEKNFNEDIQKLLIEKEVYSDEYKQHSKLLKKLKSQAKELSFKKETNKKFKPEDELKLKELITMIEEVKKEKKNTSTKISKLAASINKDLKFLNYEKKRFMDAIRILARNIFYKLIRIFRPIYDNYRDDHKLIRELTQASGIITNKNDTIICAIDTPRNYDKRQQKSIEIFLEILTEFLNNGKKTFNHKNIKLEIL